MRAIPCCVMRSRRRKKMAIGQLIMHGREHLVGITAHKKGLMLLILRYADELRKPEPYFDKIEAKDGRRRGEARHGLDRAGVRQIPT